MPTRPANVTTNWYLYYDDSNVLYRIKLPSDLAAVASFQALAPGSASFNNTRDVRDAGIRPRGIYLKATVAGRDKHNFAPVPTPNHNLLTQGGTVNFEGRTMVITGTRHERKRL